jgi:AcrR family transcriptional regulator
VLAAAYEIVASQGYDGLTVDAIASVSGVHKTTIYRRWETADAVLLDAVIARAEEAIPLARTDDAMADLAAMAWSVAENLADPMARAIAAASLSRSDNDALGGLSDQFWTLRIEGASAIVVTAQSQGAIDARLDPGAVVERIVGPIWFRSMVLRIPVDRDFAESLVYALA